MNRHNFRLPDGVEYIGEDGDNLVMRVEIPLDDDGFFGRQCPSCAQLFRVAHDDYEALPDDTRLWCVYCGHNDDHSEFLTDRQRERIMRPASDIATQLVGQMLDDSFGRLARQPSRGDFISVSWTYRSTPYYPEPLPDIDEERLVRVRTCSTCLLRYAVFGDHRFCPVCGQLPPGVVATDALAAERARLDALNSIPPTSLGALREQGVLDRIYVDTIENLVGIVEAVAAATFAARVPAAASVVRGMGNVFQRLDDTADLFRKHVGADLPGAVGETSWSLLRQTWAARHVFTHRDGIVDQRYLDTVPTAAVSIGQRLTITEATVRQAIDAAERLCEAVSGASSDTTSSATRT